MPDGSEFDAIIIGAGPGGLTCSMLLAKAGVKVLILEKSDVVVAEPDYSVKMDLPSIEALHFSIIPKFRGNLLCSRHGCTRGT